MTRLTALALAALAGCGYTTGLALAPQYDSLGVELFGNDSPERDLERDLHVALTQVVRDRVDAALLAPGRADLVLRGTLTEYGFRPGIRSPQNERLETGLIVRAQALLWDRERDELVAGPVRSAAHVGYALDDPFAESDARRRVLDLLAERLVLELLTKEPQERPAGPMEASKR